MLSASSIGSGLNPELSTIVRGSKSYVIGSNRYLSEVTIIKSGLVAGSGVLVRAWV